MSNHSDSEGGASDFEVISQSPSPPEEDEVKQATGLNMGVLSDNLDTLASLSESVSRSNSRDRKRSSTSTFSEILSSQYSNSQVSSSPSEALSCDQTIQIKQAFAEVDRLKIENSKLELKHLKALKEIKRLEEENVELQDVITHMTVRLEEHIAMEQQEADSPHGCPFKACNYKVWVWIIFVLLAFRFGLIFESSSRKELELVQQKLIAAQRAMDLFSEEEREKIAQYKKREFALQDEIDKIKETSRKTERDLRKYIVQQENDHILSEAKIKSEITSQVRSVIDSFNDVKKKHQDEIAKYQKRLTTANERAENAVITLEALKYFADEYSQNPHDRYGFDKPFNHCMEILAHEKLCRLLADGLEYQAEELTRNPEIRIRPKLEL